MPQILILKVESQKSDTFRDFMDFTDFICVGMFDFQVIDNVNTANEIPGTLRNRERNWVL